jgi:hypothetical protein
MNSPELSRARDLLVPPRGMLAANTLLVSLASRWAEEENPRR